MTEVVKPNVANNRIGKEAYNKDYIELQLFLENWDSNYKKEISKIDIFNTNVTKNFSANQKEFFARTFYHIRGHFYKFLWLLGNQAPNDKAKQQIIYNIEEEFGGNNPSHEELYFRFADSLGLDIRDEFITDEHHLPFIKKFNTEHLKWLDNHDWISKWSAFSAYERLDNIDYANLLNLAKSLGAKENGLVFFIIHNKADHFDRTYHGLEDAWNLSKENVKQAFQFIGEHQINMWKLLSEATSEK